MINRKCTECFAMVNAGEIILEKGLVSLSDYFNFFFLVWAIAKRRLLHLPLAANTIGKSSSSVTDVYLLKHTRAKLIDFIDSKITKFPRLKIISKIYWHWHKVTENKKSYVFKLLIYLQQQLTNSVAGRTWRSVVLLLKNIWKMLVISRML